MSRAALKLHVAQPALSRQIRDLEDELGVALFERGAKSVRLTQAGRAFLVEARAVLKRSEDAIAVVRSVAGQGELHIGYAPSLTARWLPATLRAFQPGMPHVKVKLLPLSPAPEPIVVGIITAKARLSPAAEEFCQCARQAVSAKQLASAGTLV